MSMFSAFFTRVKSTLSAGVSLVPVVGGLASRAIDGIHTGDEHQNENGEWVSNSTGALVMQPPTAALQAEMDRVAAFNAAELARLRQNAADTVARIGTGASLEMASRLGPEGNIYSTLKNPVTIGASVVAVLALLFLAMGKRK